MIKQCDNKEFNDSILDRKGQKSSMRFVLIRVLRMVEILAYSSIVIQVIIAIRDGDVNWNGYAIFIGALTTLLGSAVTGKWLQKKEEVKQDINEYNEIP